MSTRISLLFVSTLYVTCGFLLPTTYGSCLSYAVLENTHIKQYWVSSTGSGSRVPLYAYDGNLATYYDSLSPSLNLDAGYHWLILNISSQQTIVMSSINITSPQNLSIYLSNAQPEFQPGFDSKDQARLTASSWATFASGHTCVQTTSDSLSYDCTFQSTSSFTYVLITYKPKEVSTNVYEKLVIFEVGISYLVVNTPISLNISSSLNWLVTCSKSVSTPDCDDYTICHSRNDSCWNESYITAENISTSLDPTGPYYCLPRAYSSINKHRNVSVTWYTPLGESKVHISLVSRNYTSAAYRIHCYTPESLPGSRHDLSVSSNSSCFYTELEESMSGGGLYGGNSTLTSVVAAVCDSDVSTLHVRCLVMQDFYEVSSENYSFMVDGTVTTTTTTTIATTITTTTSATTETSSVSSTASSTALIPSSQTSTTTASLQSTAVDLLDKKEIWMAISGGAVFIAMLMLLGTICCILRCKGYRIVSSKNKDKQNYIDFIPEPQSLAYDYANETCGQNREINDFQDNSKHRDRPLPEIQKLRKSSVPGMYETVNGAGICPNYQNSPEYINMPANNSNNDTEFYATDNSSAIRASASSDGVYLQE